MISLKETELSGIPELMAKEIEHTTFIDLILYKSSVMKLFLNLTKK